jgi:hypothetical protein
LEQNTRVLEKLGKRLGGRLYSATIGSCWRRGTAMRFSLSGIPTGGCTIPSQIA